MAVFLSYAHQDAERVEELRRDLEDLAGTVWQDRSLTGGQVWWDEILVQIRNCDLFVLAMSVSSLASEACRSELGYALALDRAFLAIRIDDCDVASAPENVRRTQLVDFQTRDVNSAKALAKAVFRAQEAAPLPSVLPDPPPVPRSYQDRFAALNDPYLTMDDQISLFARLKFDIEDGTNAAEATSLMRRLQERTDLSWKVHQDITAILGDGKVGGARTASSPDVPDEGRIAPSTPLGAPLLQTAPTGPAGEVTSAMTPPASTGTTIAIPKVSLSGLTIFKLFGFGVAVIVGIDTIQRFQDDWYDDCSPDQSCVNVRGVDPIVGLVTAYVLIPATLLGCVACLLFRGRRRLIAAAATLGLEVCVVIGRIVTWLVVPNEFFWGKDGHDTDRLVSVGQVRQDVLQLAAVVVVAGTAMVHGRRETRRLRPLGSETTDHPPGAPPA